MTDKPDTRPGLSLLQYAMSEAGKADPNLTEEQKRVLRKVWRATQKPTA
jgi:hypothetical protein